MKKYSGFTLIEMLIVMGIIIILMAAGIAGGRFALQRANRIQKISAADNIEQALWGYYTDNRRFPGDGTGSDLQCQIDFSPEDLLTDDTLLATYIDAGQFDGGSDGSFWYLWGGQGQEFIVCVSLGGNSDDQGLGIYCTGNGMDTLLVGPSPADNIYQDGDDYTTILASAACRSNWDGEARSW